ncbi:MAG TPA: rRNA adenine N-6-methyltransferase family protein [Rhizomicrobium sp.]|nr:rRNA adenine N-6-methyltransferase family protein [Rhizomicrobium sp.]
MFDSLRFIARAVARPKSVGAVAPSSEALARAMAAQIDPSADGLVLELGPGTGVATAALVARGITPERIVAVEYDPHFAKFIAERFPRVTVIEGDAFALDATLGARFSKPFIGAVSGVPLLNFTMAERQIFVSGVLAKLTPGAPLAQFSYSLGNPSVIPPDGVSVARAKLVPFNLPPARVWVYRRA